MRKHLICLLLCFVLTSAARATNAFLPIGYGVKSKGMGGIGIAYPQDAFVSAHNPAGLVWICSRTDLNFQWLQPKAQYVIRCLKDSELATYGNRGDSYLSDFRGEWEEEKADRSITNMWWPEAAVNWHYCPSQAIGFAVYSAGEWDTKYNKPVDAFGGLTPLRSGFHQIYLTPAWSWRITRCHSVGIAVNIAFGGIDFRGVDMLPSHYHLSSEKPNKAATSQESIEEDETKEHPAKTAEIPLDSKKAAASIPPQATGIEWEAGISARVGWMYRILPCLQVGLTYQTPTWYGRFNRYNEIIPGNGKITIPSQLGGGFYWRFHQLMGLSVDVVKLFWDQGRFFRNSGNNEGEPGSGDGPGLGWNNQTVFKAGVDWEIRDNFTLRLGFNHAMSPIPTDETLINILDALTVQDTLTFGATYYCKCHEFSVAYQRGFTHGIEGRHEIHEENKLVEIRSRQSSVAFSWGYRF